MTTTSARQSRPPLRVVVLVAMTVANGMVLVDQTAVPLILPSVIHEFGIGAQAAQWVLNASLLMLAGFLVFGGRLGDALGLRRVFVMGSILFAGASACAGLSPTFGVLLVFRVLQGLGGALMLPTSVAIVSHAYSGPERGGALGTMGGAAAVAGALGPVIGGGLTSLLGWRSVLLVNVPLAVLAVGAALFSVPREAPTRGSRHIDFLGTGLLSVGLVCLVFGLSQSEVWGFSSPGVLIPLLVSAVAAPTFVLVELHAAFPLLDLRVLVRHHNYLGATISQGITGMAEMGLGLLLPLLLILNLGMSPGLAGLALLPATLPMIVVAPLAGRWYDRAGGRAPLAIGFAVLALSGALLAAGVHIRSYWPIFPGMLVYGIGLALVLTVNDPVSLDTLDERSEGQASGVSATAEQFGGALGIATLYLIFHTVYVHVLNALIGSGPLPALSPQLGTHFKDAVISAEQTGLNPSQFPKELRVYLPDAYVGSVWGMAAAFLTVTSLALVGLAAVVLLVRKPAPAEGVDAGAPSVTVRDGEVGSPRPEPLVASDRYETGPEILMDDEAIDRDEGIDRSE